MKSNGNGLATLSKATRMLAEATTIQDIMAVENLAQRARDYAKAAGMGREATNNAAIIMLNAQRKAGETLIAMQRRGELAEQGGDRKSKSHDGILLRVGRKLGSFARGKAGF